MEARVKIIGGGLAGSEAALRCAALGAKVNLVEMRGVKQTPVHKTARHAELVCSNSFKSMKPDTAAGLLKAELKALCSELYGVALETSVPAGGALAVDRELFSERVDELLGSHAGIECESRIAESLVQEASGFDALILATGPLTDDALASDLESIIGGECLAFFDAAAPVVSADSLDRDIVFSQSRYEDGSGDYLNAPLSRERYGEFIDALLDADRVLAKDFETRDLFQACQPIEQIARAGRDAPRFGPMKPVGLVDPATGRRPWAAVQLRAENRDATCYNLVGFQTNLTFPEQARVFRLIPGLEHAEFLRYGVMHRNTFIDAPRLLDAGLRCSSLEGACGVPVYVAGQLSGTEGYSEAIRGGLHAAISCCAGLRGLQAPRVPRETAFGCLLDWATDPQTKDYQPSHVNFGMFPPLEPPVRQKQQRYAAFAKRANEAMAGYCAALQKMGLLP